MRQGTARGGLTLQNDMAILPVEIHPHRIVCGAMFTFLDM